MGTPKILIVEDEIIIAMDIQYTLESLGYKVSGVVSSGEESIEKASQTYPDLVLMDVKLKGSMDGIRAAEEIYERFGIPIVYLTAYGDEDVLERMKKAKMFSHVSKPFEIRCLQTAIEQNLASEDRLRSVN